MSEKDDKSYEDGIRDQKIEDLGKRVTRIEGALLAILGAVAWAWAKLVGLFE